jgi:3-deoxy-D-manno-octulosonic-acid transferase
MTVGSPFIAAYLAQRYVSGKSRPGWRERWGHLPAEFHSRSDSRRRLWVHAVSAGEVVAAVPILRELRRRLPHDEILLSTITPAGHEMAEQQALPYVDGLFYFPFDLPWVARRVVGLIRPTVFVSLESEMWPNLLHELKRQGATTVLVNGRISEKNFQRVQKRVRGRLSRWLYRWMLSNMDRLLMQSENDAERIGTLGAGPNVVVLGNSKFDQEIARLNEAQVQALRQELKLPDEAPVFVAGSTRSPEEEAQVLSAYKTMQQQVPDLCLLIAPRQIERAGELADAMRAAGLQPVRRTQLAASQTPVTHLILDTIGELARVYAVATVAFVGNSFSPVNKGGGQNLLQPLAHGKPVLFGPLTATIRSEVALATEAGVGFEVADSAALAQQGLRLLSDAGLRREIETKAIALIYANQGVSARYAEAVVEMADGANPPSRPAEGRAMKRPQQV